MSDTTVSVDTITRVSGIAGQYAYRVQVTYRYSDGSSETSVATFTSSAYGMPVVLTSAAWPRGLHVYHWQQYGMRLDRAWIRRFYGVETLSQ